MYNLHASNFLFVAYLPFFAPQKHKPPTLMMFSTGDEIDDASAVRVVVGRKLELDLIVCIILYS